ncbi:VanZ family protein [Anaerolentibacter hominis]|uniref:VanZ family protein n=1 Tax=Anaerolentibacter hominis TaxID=3079009 RepID=UPI0031B7EB71
MVVTKKQKTFVRNVITVAFILYLAGMIYFLFFSERYGRLNLEEEYRYNLHLFNEIKRYIQYKELLGPEYFIINIFGNILAFAPFGFMVPVINARYGKFIDVFVLSFLLTLTIETMQLLLKVGVFDVDDLFMNTLGGLLGYGVYRFCKWMMRKK